MRSTFRTLWFWTALAAIAALAAEPLAARADDRAPWRPFTFGVMSDTQWKRTDVENNPNTVAVGIIDQLNRRFIYHGVKFVIQVGDLTDNGSVAAMDTRAAAAQALHDAGIGFFPLRGNHEGSQAAAVRFQELYPQARGEGPGVVGARNFSSPFPRLQGLSYSFDHGNARFVLLDQFTRTDGTSHLGSWDNNAIDQLPWISRTLAAKPGPIHAFVFAHKGLITGNQADVLFGPNPAANPGAQNTFMGSLAAAGVRYFWNGHDHMHRRALVVSPDRTAEVQAITAASDSFKFYVPTIPSRDDRYNVPPRETMLSEELFTIGYYLVHVDGPEVTVEYWASPNGCGDCDLAVTPELHFTRRETFGYSLNGREYLVEQGATYAGIEGRFGRTEAKVLGGINLSTGVDHAGRRLSQLVTTAWTEGRPGTRSHVLTIRGMELGLGSERTSPYALSISYDGHLHRDELESGRYGLATLDARGRWMNAVDRNFGGKKRFVVGPWDASHGVGTYGVDPATRTVWAVVDYDGAEFAAAEFHRECSVKDGNGDGSGR